MNLILVIGERPEQAKALAERLGLVGVEAVPCARDWKLAVRSLTSHSVDLILLHVDGSDESAKFFQILKDLTDVPVLTLGVGNEADQMIWYLDHGAVDYVARTIPQSALGAKIASIRRALQGTADRRILRVGDLTIDLDRRLISQAGETVSLTPIEFRLLGVLAQNAGRACSHQMLLQTVWGADFEDCSHYLRLYIGYLRQKLEVNPRRPKTIVTEWGYGYRLVGAQSEMARALPQRVAPLTTPG